MNEKGITLVALIITIIITIMIAGISITASINNATESKEDIATTELQMVAHALVETNTKLVIAKEKDNTFGNPIQANIYEEVNNVLQREGRQLKGNIDDYKILTPEDGLKQIGINNAEDTYVVSFKTGEVFNYTMQKVKSGDILYINAYGE